MVTYTCATAYVIHGYTIIGRLKQKTVVFTNERAPPFRQSLYLRLRYCIFNKQVFVGEKYLTSSQKVQLSA